MKLSKNIKADLKHYFKTYEESAECFVTSDGTVFHKQEHAQAHTDSLDDRTISSFDRDYVLNLKDEDEETAVEPQKKEETPVVEKNPDMTQNKEPVKTTGKNTRKK